MISLHFWTLQTETSDIWEKMSHNPIERRLLTQCVRVDWWSRYDKLARIRSVGDVNPTLTLNSVSLEIYFIFVVSESKSFLRAIKFRAGWQKFELFSIFRCVQNLCTQPFPLECVQATDFDSFRVCIGIQVQYNGTLQWRNANISVQF